MRLAEIISDCEIINSRGDLNVEVNEIRYDSRSVTPGDMFVAIEGFKTDGHNYIAQSVEQGAKVVVVNNNRIDISTIREDVTVIVTSDTRKFTGYAADILNNKIYGDECM